MLRGVTPEEFINKNPFPANGTELNMELVKQYKHQNATAKHKEQIVEQLLKINARLIYIVYDQHGYGESLTTVMSFVYEGIRKAVNDFDPSIGMPFYHFVIQKCRGILQNNYNYTNKLIHIPVMKKNEVEHDFSDINDYLEHESMKFMESSNPHNPLLDELRMLLVEYQSQDLPQSTIDDFYVLKLYLEDNTLKDISEKLNISTNRVKKMKDSATDRLRKFHLRWLRRN